MKILTIIGKENSGKTTLIKDLFNYLKQNEAFMLYYKVTGAHYEDFHSVLICKGKVIAFCSIGDYADDDVYDANDKLWPLKYIEEGLKLALEYSADILINTRTSNLNETDYKLLLQKIVKNENYISYKMKDNVFQKDCIKHNQKIFTSIFEEIQK